MVRGHEVRQTPRPLPWSEEHWGHAPVSLLTVETPRFYQASQLRPLDPHGEHHGEELREARWCPQHLPAGVLLASLRWERSAGVPTPSFRKLLPHRD